MTDPIALSHRLFAGERVVLPVPTPLLAASQTLRQRIEAVFGPEPQTAEARMTASAFRQQAAALRRAVREDPALDQAWIAAMESLGFPDQALHRDLLRLRIVPGRPETAGRHIRPLAPHRDTWGAGIAAQINWWLPLYPLSTEATMWLWPDAFDQPVANTAADWDYEALRAGDSSVALLPVATGAPLGPPEPVLIAPGEMLAFAAAHLHASHATPAGGVRFSLDTRTVWQADIDAGRGAPDVDSGGIPARWDMFERRAQQAG